MDMSNIKNYIDDRPADGVFRVHKDVYSDPQLFELEMKYIFERTWSFIGHESQIPKPHDWVATHIGRVPVLGIEELAINRLFNRGLKRGGDLVVA